MGSQDLLGSPILTEIPRMWYIPRWVGPWCSLAEHAALSRRRSRVQIPSGPLRQGEGGAPAFPLFSWTRRSSSPGLWGDRPAPAQPVADPRQQHPCSGQQPSDPRGNRWTLMAKGLASRSASLTFTTVVDFPSRTGVRGKAGLGFRLARVPSWMWAG